MANEERLEFEQTVDGLFLGALEAKAQPELMAALKAEGLDLDRPLLPAYPAEDFFRWVKVAARLRFPGESEGEACRRMGELAVHRGLAATLIGRALVVAMKALGVRRSLLRIGRSFRNGNNYIEATATQLAPTTVEVRLNTVMGVPEYFEGVLEAGTLLLGAKNVILERQPDGREGLIVRISWSEA